MIYIVALILPPLALLMAGAWFQALVNLVLFVLSGIIFVGTLSLGSPVSFPIWAICVIWALVVVHRGHTEARTRQIVVETLRDNRP